jgi:hypothetical protein
MEGRNRCLAAQYLRKCALPCRSEHAAPPGRHDAESTAACHCARSFRQPPRALSKAPRAMCLHADWRRWLTYQFAPPRAPPAIAPMAIAKPNPAAPTQAAPTTTPTDTHRHPANLFVIQCTLRPLLPTPSPLEVVAVHGITTAVLVGVGIAAGESQPSEDFRSAALEVRPVCGEEGAYDNAYHQCPLCSPRPTAESCR